MTSFLTERWRRVGEPSEAGVLSPCLAVSDRVRPGITMTPPLSMSSPMEGRRRRDGQPVAPDHDDDVVRRAGAHASGSNNTSGGNTCARAACVRSLWTHPDTITLRIHPQTRGKCPNELRAFRGIKPSTGTGAGSSGLGGGEHVGERRIR